MCRGLLGKKLGMTGMFSSTGEYVPVTIVQAGPCVVTQVKREITDGYASLQLGFEEKKSSRTNKPIKGHLKKSGEKCFAFLREFPVENPDEYSLGQTVMPDIFSIGEHITVTGKIKGRGFSGVIKRHGFHGGRQTHGSKSKRIPGSIGCSAWPAKVIRGKKMPGQYGNTKKTVQNLEIIDIRPEENLIMVKGALPGPISGLVALYKK
ncbi:50S ribosomal protein L3 [Desulfonema magnum]|uniref:Large ribosomal subunit protein uL3 n=1 Tax=Desulfonema magnum TaxID=45655 RepID=A0A975BHF1_9BACT|nr:50S ribosomal protein L3 [Desulfonema magnum]QTA85368.1 50S ribosomal protein L3 [Desulfonema magnum]